MVDGVTQMTLSALQIAGPLIAVLFLADVGLGLLTRVAPALNAFVLGFPLKIILTIALVALGAVALPQLVGSLTGTAVHDMLGVR
jgi:flagellar biosynthetic protein FliR